jgi:threonine dehydrogenase-like Zn-dependent dehydrogenase
VGEGVPDDEAVLTEPFACCVHAVHRARPAAGQRALVIGAGTMGLLQVAALRALAPGTAVTVLARHAFQAAHATRLGAARVVLARGDYLAELADAGETRLLQPILGAPIGVGGFDLTFICIGGARGVEDALRFTTQGGTIVLLGNASALRRVDWTPLWLKELTIAGTLAYGAHGAHGGAGHGGASTHAFSEAAELIGERRVELSGLVTHQFGLGEYRRALATARERGGSGSVKVAFRF